MSNNLRLASLVFLSAITACGGDDGTGTTGAQLTGRVEGGAGLTVEAAAVSVDGTLTPTATTTAGADGRYTIEAELPDGAIALVVRTDEATPRATIVSDVELAWADGEMMVAPPIDAASTVVTDVFLQAGGDLELERLALVMSPSLTAQIDGAADRDAAVSAAADAAITASAAWDLARGHDGQASIATNTMIHAHVAQAASLDLATSTAASATAYGMYVQAAVSGHRDAGFQASALVQAAGAAVDAMVIGTDDTAGTTSADLAALVGVTTAGSVESQISTVGASGDWSAVFDAGATLRAALTGTAGDDFLVAALVTYQTAVVTAIAVEHGLSIDVTVALAADIDNAGVQLDAALETAVTAEAIVAARLAFHASIVNELHLALLTSAGLDPVSARATLDVMADLEAATH